MHMRKPSYMPSVYSSSAFSLDSPAEHRTRLPAGGQRARAFPDRPEVTKHRAFPEQQACIAGLHRHSVATAFGQNLFASFCIASDPSQPKKVIPTGLPKGRFKAEEYSRVASRTWRSWARCACGLVPLGGLIASMATSACAASRAARETRTKAAVPTRRTKLFKTPRKAAIAFPKLMKDTENDTHRAP